MSLTEFQKKIVESERRYFEDVRGYTEKIKAISRSILGEDTKVMLFGSAVKGDYIVGKSDVDILIISEDIPQTVLEQACLRIKILKALGDVTAPFEIHFADERIYNRWYKNFIKGEYVEI
jgi:predicted nucleotidyltransferase